jgi:hypothetical protein
MLKIGNFPAKLQFSLISPHDSNDTTPAGFNVSQVWALPRSLAATGRIEFLSLPPGTEMVHFPGFASLHL